MNAKFFVIPVLVIAAIPVFGQATREADHVALATALGTISGLSNVHFTIEYDCRSGNPSALQGASLAGFDKLRNEQGVLEYLRVALPEASIEHDLRVKDVIHIRDKSLPQGPDDVMEKRFSLKFSGTPSELLGKLSSATNGRLTGDGDRNLNEPSGDYSTTISVDAADLDARAVLSDFIPLAHYSAIIWSACTWKYSDGKIVSVVTFNGSKVKEN
jgi:hypothetical protein